MRNLLLAMLAISLSAQTLQAQNVGIGTASPGTKLHVAGGIASTPNTAAAAASVTIPDNTSVFRLSATAGTQANALSMSSPTEGQYLTIYNEDGDAATFAGQTIAATSGVASFQYINGAWRFVSSNQSSGGSFVNNNTSQQTSANYNIDGNGLLSGTASVATIGTGTASTANGNYQLTLTPNSTNKSGISIVATGGSSTNYGLNVSAGSSAFNGILSSNSSTGSGLFEVGGVLSATNIVSGYSAYRNGSGLSYGLYGINGTNATYATNANTWAAFLQGRTVISSESSPSSGLGTDLEVRNTTTGAAAPATVSLRQTTSLTSSTTNPVLANLNFGDNAQTGPQAQIEALRDATGAVGDLPTALTFSTTADNTATLSERLRISNAGNVGIGSTGPSSLLSVGSTNQFQVNSSGDIVSIKGASYAWPSAHAAGVLTSDASGNLSWGSSGGSGTVTSVALSLPSIFSVSGSPVTSSGTLTGTLASETANTLLAAPNGSAGTPTFRSLVAADLPALGQFSTTTGSTSATGSLATTTLTAVPGLTQTFTLASAMYLNISTQGTFFQSAYTGTDQVGVYVIVDGTSYFLEEVLIPENYTFSSSYSLWSGSTGLSVASGSHTVSISVYLFSKNGTPGNLTAGGTSGTVGQAYMTVTALRP